MAFVASKDGLGLAGNDQDVYSLACDKLRNALRLDELMEQLCERAQRVD